MTLFIEYPKTPGPGCLHVCSLEKDTGICLHVSGGTGPGLPACMCAQDAYQCTRVCT